MLNLISCQYNFQMFQKRARKHLEGVEKFILFYLVVNVSSSFLLSLLSQRISFSNFHPSQIDQTLWGELESESEDESESSEEEEDDEDDGEATGLQTPVVDPGLATPSGTTSVGGKKIIH